LQSRLSDLESRGLGLVAISYDPPPVLKAFAAARGITFPLLSDSGSAIIKRYGLLNTTLEPDSRFYGVPFPGTFIVDRRGVVRSRHFERAYQERNTVASILVARGDSATGPRVDVETPHLTLSAAISDAEVAPGERIALTFEITPRPGMHVYAPGAHSYQVVRVTLDPQPWLRVHEMTYPASEIYHFAPLDERVEVYQRRFRLVQEVTILATPEAQKILAGQDRLTLAGRLAYQACDDKVCYTPQEVPVRWSLSLKPLDRRPPG
jgi:hypothetical protein